MPAWVKDEDLWAKAKAAALKNYSEDHPAFWAVVTHVYKNMGGSMEADGGSGFAQALRSKETASSRAARIWKGLREAVAEKPMPDPVADVAVHGQKVRNQVNAGDVVVTQYDGKNEEVVVEKIGLDKTQVFGVWLTGPLKGEEAKVAFSDIVSVKQKQSGLLRLHDTRFREAAGSASPGSKFRATIIQEGLGNFGDRFYYTRGALEGAATLFEGKKIYADHPRRSDEEDLPERSVRDVLGHFENVSVADAEDGHAVLEADVVVLPEKEFDWARGLMKHAVQYNKKYPDRDFVGLSINAFGDAEEQPISSFLAESEIPDYCKEKLDKAKEAGVEAVRVVSGLTDAVSCDLVTEAGAGGRVVKLIEGRNMAKRLKHAAHPAAGKAQKKGIPATEADGEHADAAMDVELIKSIVKKYMGGGDEEPNEEQMKMVHEAHQAACEMGLEGEEAMKAAGYGMQMMKKLGEAYGKDSAVENQEGAALAQESNRGTGDDEDEEGDMEKENLRLRGEMASLDKRLRGFEFRDYLEKKLAESGEDRRITKAFREGLKLEDIRSTKEVDAKWEVFMSGMKAAREAGGEHFPMTEKTEPRDGDGVLSLADCI